MSARTRNLGFLLLFAALAIAGVAAAKQITNQNFGLTATQVDCDGYRTFGYVATWRPPAGSTNPQVYTANKCRVGPINCDATGQCSAKLSGCVPGPSWVDVKATIATGDILSQRIAVPWPTDASGTKKVCS
jgi:hypothetical protein